jgi:hypothetical protein
VGIEYEHAITRAIKEEFDCDGTWPHADILDEVETLALERDLLAEKLNAREVQVEQLHAYAKALKELIDDLLTCQYMLKGEIESGVTWRNANQMDVCLECPIQCNRERPSLKSRAEDLGVSFR